MRRVFDLLDKVIDNPATVLLTGETGTGKTLLARHIHLRGPRQDKPFIEQNCGTLPETLLESELFGHKRGAFTGAVQDRKGLFEAVDGGTLLLDEISEMSPTLQVKLLQVLQDGRFRRVGESEYRRADVRVIAATNRDLSSRNRKRPIPERSVLPAQRFPPPCPAATGANRRHSPAGGALPAEIPSQVQQPSHRF